MAVLRHGARPSLNTGSAHFTSAAWAQPGTPNARGCGTSRAAEQGNVKAMHNLAVLSVSGGRSDYSAAAKWFAQAADFGLTDSQVNLAILYQNGLGVSKDLTQAYKWLTLAARGGDREAAGRAAQVKAQLSPADVQTADADVAAWRARVPDAAANERRPRSLLDTRSSKRFVPATDPAQAMRRVPQVADDLRVRSQAV